MRENITHHFQMAMSTVAKYFAAYPIELSGNFLC